MISSRHLQVLAAVIRQGSATGAAAELNLSQPTVSKAVKRLEDVAGMRLFERIEGRLRPTAEAVILAREAERLSEEMTAFQSLVTDIRNRGGGPFRLATAPAFSATIVPRAVVAMAAANPDLRILVNVEAPPLILENAASGRIDLGVVHYTEEEPLAATVPLSSGRIIAIMRPDHELAAKAVLQREDLKGRALIAYRGNLPFARSIRERLIPDDPAPTISIEAEPTTLLRDLVRLGSGIALVDEFSLWFEQWSDLAVRPIKPAVEVMMAVVHVRGRPLTTAASTFITHLEEVIARGRKSGLSMRR
ncbi:LysR family transcriptional regulator [Pelagibius sp.]|uniref:LysR family transcriptional regulator n=1 Tax=Pelagibius sp. TaxID=1931238 RepID=UPI003B50442B